MDRLARIVSVPWRALNRRRGDVVLHGSVTTGECPLHRASLPVVDELAVLETGRDGTSHATVPPAYPATRRRRAAARCRWVTPPVVAVAWGSVRSAGAQPAGDGRLALQGA
ncbi:hypothetical protein [Deinococcus sonorensis]|uniref:Uncharacterized protein n=2 Tax=Deinococcus sonorensis TaxID=309891 RepID=A0AAU7U6V4_9DEIO